MINRSALTRSVTILVAVVGFLWSSAPAREISIDSTRVQLFTDVQRLIYNNNFDSAFAVVDTFQPKDPDDPCGWLSRSGVLLAWMTEQEDDSLKDEFFAAVDTVLSLVPEPDDTCHPYTPTAALLRGHAKTYRALFESKFGSKLKAVKIGYAAKSEYETGLKCDSNFYDLYLGLGGFHFWKSVKAGVLRQIGLLSNDMEKGINELGLARDSSRFSRQPAMNALLWIMIEQGKFDSAQVICSTLAVQYPDGTAYKWAQARIQFDSGNFADAARAYVALYEYYLDNPGNYFNVVECGRMVVECFKQLGLKEEAARLASGFIEHNGEIPPRTRKRQANNIKYLQWWADKMSFYEDSATDDD